MQASACSTLGAVNCKECAGPQISKPTTILCAMVGKAVVRRKRTGPTRVKAPERMATRSLVRDVHAWKHACGELRVCQAHTMNIQRDSTDHRCHVRALAAFCARGAVRFAAALFSQCAATHSTFRTHDMGQIGGLGQTVPRLPSSYTSEAGACVSAVACVHRWPLFRMSATNSVGPRFVEANGYKSKRTACQGTDTQLSVWAHTY